MSFRRACLGATAAALAACAPGGPVAFDAVSFARDVAAAAQRADHSRDCAVSLPATNVSSATVRSAVQDFVARVVEVPAAQVSPDRQVCGDAGHASCAALFENDLFHGNGSMGTELRPLADRVEQVASDVELVIWSPRRGDLTLPPAISLAGIKDGRLVGLVFFCSRTSCSPP
jgi:hypothetical protein